MAVIASSNAAEARDDARRKIDIEATSLPDAIAELSREAFVSVGTEGTLPRGPTRRLHGSFTIDAALARLLRGSGHVARRVGPTAWRIERAPGPSDRPTTSDSPPGRSFQRKSSSARPSGI